MSITFNVHSNRVTSLISTGQWEAIMFQLCKSTPTEVSWQNKISKNVVLTFAWISGWFPCRCRFRFVVFWSIVFFWKPTSLQQFTNTFWSTSCFLLLTSLRIYGVLSRGKWETRDQKNADELKATVKETWASPPLQQCHKLITSMPRRIEAVIKAKGAKVLITYTVN